MKKMNAEEYRALLKEIRSEQPIVSSAEAKRQYQEVKASYMPTAPPAKVAPSGAGRKKATAA
jgi:hypothetical protein